MALRLDLDGWGHRTRAPRNTDDAGSIRDFALMLNIVVGEFSEFMVIDTDDFRLLGCAEGKTGDEVHDEKDEAGAEKAVGETGNTVCELIGELDVMAVQPAATDCGETVEMGDIVTRAVRLMNNQLSMLQRYSRSEQARQQVTYDTTDTVHGKDVERVINSH